MREGIKTQKNEEKGGWKEERKRRSRGQGRTIVRRRLKKEEEEEETVTRNITSSVCSLHPSCSRDKHVNIIRYFTDNSHHRQIIIDY